MPESSFRNWVCLPTKTSRFNPYRCEWADPKKKADAKYRKLIHWKMRYNTVFFFRIFFPSGFQKILEKFTKESKTSFCLRNAKYEKEKQRKHFFVIIMAIKEFHLNVLIHVFVVQIVKERVTAEFPTGERFSSMIATFFWSYICCDQMSINPDYKTAKRTKQNNAAQM